MCVELKAARKSDLGGRRGGRGKKGWANDQVRVYYYYYFFCFFYYLYCNYTYCYQYRYCRGCQTESDMNVNHIRHNNSLGLSSLGEILGIMMSPDCKPTESNRPVSDYS